MKLKKKFVKKRIELDLTNKEDIKVIVTDVYEDVLVESLYKRLIKNFMFWVSFIQIIFGCLILYLIHTKLSIIFFSLLLSFHIYKLYQTIKDEIKH